MWCKLWVPSVLRGNSWVFKIIAACCWPPRALQNRGVRAGHIRSQRGVTNIRMRLHKVLVELGESWPSLRNDIGIAVCWMHYTTPYLRLLSGWPPDWATARTRPPTYYSRAVWGILSHGVGHVCDEETTDIPGTLKGQKG